MRSTRDLLDKMKAVPLAGAVFIVLRLTEQSGSLPPASGAVK
ncbi:hypothetical protein [Alkalicoccus luteus]